MLTPEQRTLAADALRFYAAHWGSVGTAMRKGHYLNPANDDAVDGDGEAFQDRAACARSLADDIEAERA